MQRYAFFAGQHHYPEGGFNDFVRTSDDIEALKKSGEVYDWAHIVDLTTMTNVWATSRGDRFQKIYDELKKQTFECVEVVEYPRVRQFKKGDRIDGWDFDQMKKLIPVDVAIRSFVQVR